MSGTGVTGLQQRLRRIVDDLSGLHRKVDILGQNVAVLGGGLTLSGDVIATLTGHVEPGGAHDVTWTKVKSDDGVTYSGARIQLPGDGQYAFGYELTGTWPAGYHRYDHIDGVTVNVLQGTGAGNVNADPAVSRAFVNQGQTSHGVIAGYGNAIALGITSVTHHNDPVAGEPYGVPTAINITLYVSLLAAG